MSMHSHYRPYRPPVRSLPGKPPGCCRSSTGTLPKLRAAAYIISVKCEQREVMRSGVWRAGASETHTHSTARIAETDITPVTAASSMRSTSAPRRPPTKLPRPCPQPLRVSPLRRPRACRRGCAPEIARNQLKNACCKPPIPKLGQSSAQDQR